MIASERGQGAARASPPDLNGVPDRRPSANCLLISLLALGGCAAINIWFLIDDCPLDLAGDEAHYWEWSRRLDWCYYSKGPLVAYIIAASRWLLSERSQQLVGTEMLAVRAPAVALSILSGIGLFVLGRGVSGRPRVGLLAILISVTTPLFAAGSILMTIDAPLICAWTWALVCIERVLKHESFALWAATGLFIAVGILAKPTMVLLAPVLLLLLVIEPRSRGVLGRPGVYVAALLSVLGFVPILLWNARNGWVSFHHIAGQAGVTSGIKINAASVPEYLVGQALLANPVWAAGILLALGAALRRPASPAGRGGASGSTRLLACAALVPWAVFLGFGFVTKIQPNWPAPALVAAAVLLADWADSRLQRGVAGRRTMIGWAAGGALLGVAAVGLARQSEVLSPLLAVLVRGSPPWDLTPAARLDPTARLRGWSKLAAVEPVLEELRAARGVEPFLVADDYQLASELAFYCESHPTVYCIQSALGDRYNQYDLWRNPIRDAEEFIGRPCVYVGQLRPELTGDEGTRAALPGLRKVTTIEHYVGGLRYQVWSVFSCDGFAGFQSRAQTPHY